jgi:triosephosphate isomerase (TIM)
MNLFVANWKMNMTRAEARAYVEELSRRLGDRDLGVELVIAPSFTALDAAADERGRWSIAAQNVSSQPHGALTGEVSARQLADAGCRYVIIGHSERRRILGEDGAVLAAKLQRAREAGLTPIYCVGETEQERAQGLSEAAIAGQAVTLAQDPEALPLVVAYEPVWAIGTGRIATAEDCSSACAHLRRLLASRANLRILYGGSVTPDNAQDLLDRSSPSIDGFLIGGASLRPDAFAAIAGIPNA